MTPGIYPGLSYAEYDAIDGVRWSTLKEMGRSPKHYRWRRDHPRDESDALLIGIATHLAVLEPHRFESEVVAWTGARRFGKEWAAFQAQHSVRTILREDDYQAVLEMAAAVRADPLAAPFLEGARAEATVVWIDAMTGIRCKGRIDLLARGVADLKSARSVADRDFGRSAANLGYTGQLAFYRDGVRAAGASADEAFLIAVEKDGPWDVVVSSVDEDLLELGRDEYQRYLAELVECERSGEWHGQARGAIRPLVLPAWAIPAEEGVDDLGLDWDTAGASE